MKKVLKLLISGGIAVAIASSVAIGIAINKSKSTSTENTEPVVTNEITSNYNPLDKVNDVEINLEIPGLSGGFEFDKDKYNLARQEIVGLAVDKNKTAENFENINVKANAKEVEILDLSKTIGNLKWILKYVKSPDEHTSAVSLKTLGTIKYEQTINFLIFKDRGLQFDGRRGGVFAIEVNLVESLTKIKKWEFIFTLHSQAGKSINTAKKGIMAEKMVAIKKSTIFNKVLNAQALSEAGLQILLWKDSTGAKNVAKADASDAEIAIILNKKTGKVFIWAKKRTKILSRKVIKIKTPKIQTKHWKP